MIARRRAPARLRWLPDLLFAVALVAAVFVAYAPAWQGGILWDDAGHMTRPELQTWSGLARIWFDVGATQQYYPLLHSAFWVEHLLWGDATLGYHLVNIAMHCLAALMVGFVLRRLAIPGAYLAAAIFALHPVQVESVAWITELKNTLSAVFYLSALLVYLRFDQTRKWGWYVFAWNLFFLGLLSKTVTATLPGALLVIFWWQRGRLSWKRDVLPLLPFFILGVVAGGFTAWVERKLIGAEGAPFEIGIIERFLLAGRVMWFYLGKLLWPSDLLFIYPRWTPSRTEWWQYLFPVATVSLVVALWMLRRRWRAPLAGVLFFVGTLVPVLGFCNVYPFVFSFVADHFQYLASMGIIALASAGLALLLARWRLPYRLGGYTLCVALLASLATLTWRQSRMYADLDTLYTTTIARNPQCWMAYNNLGSLLSTRNQGDAAFPLFKKALEIKEDYAEAHYNYANGLAGRGQIDKAIAHYLRAIEIRSDYALVHNNLGVLLAGHGRTAEAIEHYRAAIKLSPNYAEAHNNLGAAFADQQDLYEAIYEYQMALELKPAYAEAESNLGNALARRGQIDEAMLHLRKALELDRNCVEAHCNLGIALAGRGQYDDAVVHFMQALRVKPQHATARENLIRAQSQLDVLKNLLAQRRDQLRTQPNDTALLNDVAWMLATNPVAQLRDSAEAIALAQRAVELSGGQEPAILGTLAAAYAEANRFSDAVRAAQQAVALAAAQNKTDLAAVLRARVKLYEAREPYRELP